MIIFAKVLVVGALASLALADDVAKDACNARCSQRFTDKALEGCYKGCQNYQVSKDYEDAKENIPLEANETFYDVSDEGNNDALTLCKHSCEDSFDVKNGDKERRACQEGCELATTSVSSESPPLLRLVFGDNLFGGLDGKDSHRNRGISFGFPLFSDRNNNDDDMGFEGISHIMNHMHEQMNKQMNSIMNSAMSMMPSSDLLQRSGGKMIILRSGPGFHEEKTFDIGPNGQMTLITNDMKNHENPLELSGFNDDVEVFDPKLVNPKENERKDQLFVEPFWKQFERQELEDLDGPRLPKVGLRPRTKCQKDNGEWSNWFACLHSNLGMPKWVVTTSICLSIIFVLWLCLVIPSNAPKQKVKSTTKKSKEAEAITIVTSSAKEDDLPPRYEDVAKVALEPVKTCIV